MKALTTLLLLFVASPAPTPTPLPLEPRDIEQFVPLFRVLVLSIQTAATLSTLATLLFVTLCLTYLVMFLLKSLLRINLPLHYKPVLTIILAVLIAVAAGIGYYLMGYLGALATGIGAAGSSVAHDVLDGIRGLKRSK